MKQKALCITTLLIAALSFTACYPTGEVSNSDEIKQYVTEAPTNNSQTADDESLNVEEHTNTELKNVKLSLDYPQSPEKIPEINSHFQKWDNEKAKLVFLEGKGDIIEESHESDLNPEEMRYVYDIPGEYRLIMESGRLSYSYRGNSNRDEYTVLQSSWSMEEIDKIFGHEELEGFSSQDAVKKVTDILDECGINEYGTPIIYPLHADIVNNYFQENFSDFAKKDGTIYSVNWTQEEEAYLIVFPQTAGDITYSLSTTSLDAIVTRDGITELSISNWNDESTTINNNQNLVYSSTDATNILINYYESAILDYPVELLNCQLTMYPESETGEFPIHYIPTWEFTEKVQVDETRFYIERTNINAITGKIV